MTLQPTEKMVRMVWEGKNPTAVRFQKAASKQEILPGGEFDCTEAMAKKLTKYSRNFKLAPTKKVVKKAPKKAKETLEAPSN